MEKTMMNNHRKNLARIRLVCLTALAAGSVAFTGCSTVPETPQGRSELTNDSTAAFHDFLTRDPSLTAFLKKSTAYAIFPSIGRGAVVFGGSYGRGEVWLHDKQIGYADVTSATFGASVGGQSYAQLIVFRTPRALERFQTGQYTFNANASAVAVQAGSAQQAKWDDDITVFIDPKGGFMADASIGGQKFNFTAFPASESTFAATDNR
jgi:lipid-binding SYLF domain-containing protein